jgi:hypothetical protein
VENKQICLKKFTLLFISFISAVCVKNKVTLFLQTHFQAPKLPLRDIWRATRRLGPHDAGPPLNILVDLQMSLKESYGSLYVGLQKHSYFELDTHG